MDSYIYMTYNKFLKYMFKSNTQAKVKKNLKIINKNKINNIRI